MTLSNRVVTASPFWIMLHNGCCDPKNPPLSKQVKQTRARLDTRRSASDPVERATPAAASWETAAAMAAGGGSIPGAAPGSPSALGLRNRLWMVEAVRRHGGVSRSALVRLSGLSKGSVTTIVQQLIRQGLLVEQSSTASAPAEGRRLGRPRVLLTLNPNYAGAVGLEITGSEVEAIVLDLQGGVRARAARPLTSTWSPAEVLAAAGETVRAVLAAAPAGGPAVRGVGLAVPGIIDAQRGVSLWIPGLLRWQNVPVADLLQRELDLPVYLDWRAYTATLAEQWFGAGRQADDFLYINVGDGVGMGAVIGGQLLRGASSMAGYLGHVYVPSPGQEPPERCYCGNTGCLELRVAVPYLIERARRALARTPLSALAARATAEAESDTALGLQDLIDAARDGDRLACSLFEDAGEALGTGIAGLIHLFNPPLVILGGPLSRAGALLLEPVQRAARRSALPPPFAAARIVLSPLPVDSALLGAGALVLRRVLGADPLLGSLGSEAA
jgi:N-acetylglucosamine repressor